MSNSAISTVYIADSETYNPSPMLFINANKSIADFYIMGIVLHDALNSAKLSIQFISNQTGDILKEDEISFPKNRRSNKDIARYFPTNNLSVPDILKLPIHISNAEFGKTYSYTVKLFEDGIECAQSSCAVSIFPENWKDQGFDYE